MCAQAPVSPGEGQIFRETLPQQSDNYPLGPDSLPHADVPAGKTFSFELSNSKVFPGTTRTINVYVPAQYTGQTAACLYVGLDGLGFRASTVFDNLIAKKQMPVTIGVGIAPGTVASSSAPQNPRFDRSLEFDMRSARLARFIEEEVLPAVEQRHRRCQHRWDWRLQCCLGTSRSLPASLHVDRNLRRDARGRTVLRARSQN
jgi:hypothetical protein